MKKAINIAAMISLLLVATNAYSITWKIKGYGGIVINPDGSQIVCPSKSSALCAEITGSIWDLLDYVFRASYSDLPDGTEVTSDANYSERNIIVTVYSQGSSTTYNHSNITVLQSCMVKKIDNNNCESTGGSAFRFQLLN